jgi:hypothetical protein
LCKIEIKNVLNCRLRGPAAMARSYLPTWLRNGWSGATTRQPSRDGRRLYSGSSGVAALRKTLTEEIQNDNFSTIAFFQRQVDNL